MEFKELFKGIDSLYVSYKGTLKEGLSELLKELKTLAQSDDEKKQALATMVIEDHNFEVSDKGARYYAYLLVDNWYQIKITDSKKQNIPTIYVQIKSELLNCLGHEYAMYKLREIVNNLLIVVEGELISRVDIFVDFVTDADIERIEKKSLVTRTRKIDKHWDGGFTGWSLGLGGVVSARLYDKTVEMKKSKKDYLKELWGMNGWDSLQRVWRLEFQSKREFLGQMSIKMYADLLSIVNDIWRYCTSDWLKIAIDDGTQNRTRWKTDPLWEMLQQIRFLDGNYTGTTREVSKARIPSDKILYQHHLIPSITSYAARAGLDVVNEEIMNRIWKESEDHLRREKGSKTEDYLRTKIQTKKRKYNKALRATMEGHITNLGEKPQP